MLMLQKYINSKQKNSEIKSHDPCLDNISKDVTFNGTEKIGVKGVVNFFLLILILLILIFF